MLRKLGLVIAILSLSGCKTIVSTSRYEPSSSIRSKGSITIGLVRYVPAEAKRLKPDQVEFNKAGSVYFDTPISDIVRRGVTRELEASGFAIQPDGKTSLQIEITRCHLADKFTSLELYMESTWTLKTPAKEVSKKQRAARRHAVYTSAKKAEDMNALVAESFEKFFSDPEVATLFAPQGTALKATSDPTDPLPVGTVLRNESGAVLGAVFAVAGDEVTVLLQGGGTITIPKAKALELAAKAQ